MHVKMKVYYSYIVNQTVCGIVLLAQMYSNSNDTMQHK